MVKKQVFDVQKKSKFIRKFEPHFKLYNLKNNIEIFNPNGVGLNNGNFIGLPFDSESANLILLPVPWDVTVSYNDGTASAPANILEASTQLDLYDENLKDAWKKGIFMQATDQNLMMLNSELREKAILYINFLENGGRVDENSTMLKLLKEINNECQKLNKKVAKEAEILLEKGKLVGIVGGDHSSPLGFLQVLAQKHNEFGVLHIDAHMDLRNAYEGFTYSHASIFHNALQLPSLTKLVQVGVRDFCDEEVEFVANNPERIHLFTDNVLKKEKFEGVTWKTQCEKIIAKLPQKVYISFDIDGLKPNLCPNTGTPVPGGLEFEEARYLLEQVVESRKSIIGFDVCEVAGTGNEWDGNVGARVLYKLCNLSIKSNKTTK
ncbi:MAG: agmatinase family protein [Prolixibacteraceae bacterium]|jgi:agmatinase|nr:agmatinase family protein [Prolixibacteraceae bacterium]